MGALQTYGKRLLWGPAQGFGHGSGISIRSTDRGALPWHWVVAGVGGEQREAWVSQQEGFFCQGGFIGRGTNPAPGRWLWGGREDSNVPSSQSMPSVPVGLGAALVARDVCVPSSIQCAQERGTWALGCAVCRCCSHCADAIPAVLPLGRGLLLEMNALLPLPAGCCAVVTETCRSVVLPGHLEVFSCWFGVGAVGPAGSGALLHPPVCPSRAALWQELGGAEHVKTRGNQGSMNLPACSPPSPVCPSICCGGVNLCRIAILLQRLWQTPAMLLATSCPALHGWQSGKGKKKSV